LDPKVVEHLGASVLFKEGMNQNYVTRFEELSLDVRQDMKVSAEPGGSIIEVRQRPSADKHYEGCC